MAWQRIGSVTVSPHTVEAEVGRLDLPPQGGVELMLRQTSPYQGFNFGYGLVSVRTALGREYGKVRCWAGQEWSAFRLGDRLSCLSSSGVLVFEPRAWNLRWVKAGFPWSVEFMADVGTVLPPDRVLGPGFQDPANRILRLVRVGTQGRIQF
jgi:hypothetical protein